MIDPNLDPNEGTEYSIKNMAQRSGGGWPYVWSLADNGQPMTTLIDEDGNVMTLDNYSGDITIMPANGYATTTVNAEALDQWMLDHPESGLYYDGWSVKREPAKIIDLTEVFTQKPLHVEIINGIAIDCHPGEPLDNPEFEED